MVKSCPNVMNANFINPLMMRKETVSGRKSQEIWMLINVQLTLTDKNDFSKKN
jgi:hypothetical protein